MSTAGVEYHYYYCCCLSPLTSALTDNDVLASIIITALFFLSFIQGTLRSQLAFCFHQVAWDHYPADKQGCDITLVDSPGARDDLADASIEVTTVIVLDCRATSSTTGISIKLPMAIVYSISLATPQRQLLHLSISYQASGPFLFLASPPQWQSLIYHTHHQQLPGTLPGPHWPEPSVERSDLKAQFITFSQHPQQVQSPRSALWTTPSIRQSTDSIWFILTTHRLDPGILGLSSSQFSPAALSCWSMRTLGLPLF